MRASIIASAVAAAGLLAGAAAAQTGDNEAGVPLTPAEAAGAWTVASQGKDLCVLTLGASHAVKAPSSCAEALTGNPTGWQPTRDGMQLTGAGGQPMLAFHRWSNSLFVSHRASGVDIQLRRGGPGG
ncbi:MAG: AprI/Inh family metalloprotease inhibitor [Phenylobacterium sp.]